MKRPQDIPYWLFAISVFVASFAASVITRDMTNDKLPKCEEDEVLVAKDYPYHKVDDLICVHIDSLER